MVLETNSQSTSRWKILSLFLIFALTIYVGASFLLYFNLRSDYATIQDQQSSLQVQLYESQQEIQRLSQQLTIADYINLTHTLPIPQIFQLLNESIVLIQTKISSGFELVDYAQGSGFVYDTNGHIITNDHVVQDADEISVTFTTGTREKATLLGRDPYSDIAVLQVNLPPETLHPVVLGNSSTLIVGEPVVAIGNPFGLSGTITAGIVSQVGRDLSAPGGYRIIDVIQIDAAINPGNSGGPLVNIWGEVVGMNTAIISGSTGVGFAIASDTIRREIQALITTGSYIHPWLGITGSDLDVDTAESLGLNITHGIHITEVIAGGPAAVGGMHVNDVLVTIDDTPIRNFNDLSVYLERYTHPMSQVTITVFRNQQQMNLQIVLGERPPP
jgi:S1-C subfamily serine protease